MVEKEGVIYSFRCKYCGKEINSLYKKQGEINFATHVMSCKKKKKEEEVKE